MRRLTGPIGTPHPSSFDFPVQERELESGVRPGFSLVLFQPGGGGGGRLAFPAARERHPGIRNQRWKGRTRQNCDL